MAAKQRHGNVASENGRVKQTGHTPGKGKHSKKREKDSPTMQYNQKQKGSEISKGYIITVVLFASMCGIIHRNHVAGMFERDRHFSHLSSLERELAFRTEMGLYYSYYKTIVEAPNFATGLEYVMYDNVTEYPQVINTLKRFNLYPEVILGLSFRTYEAVMGWMQKETKTCWTVNRGKGMAPVQSCEGLGEPSYFYVETVFLLNGVMMAVFFLFATFLSGSIFGGIITVASFFYNHGECTRVQWTPPLRESFAYPFLVIEMLIITHILRLKRPSYRRSLILAAAIISFMLPWQFAQFALLTQLMAVYAVYVLQYVGSHKVKVILAGHALGLAVSFVLLFGNEMLLASFYVSALLTITVIILLEPLLESLPHRLLILASQGGLFVIGVVGIKLMLSRLLSIKDDAHIGDILRSKFTNFRNFHTMLYTCATEFDFMEWETPGRVTATLLGPAALIAVITVIFKLCVREYAAWQAGGHPEHVPPAENGAAPRDVNQNYYRQYRSKDHAEVVYHVFQLLAFTVMALLIMRLKLFWTPHLCLFSCMLASRPFFSWVGDQKKHYSLLMLMVGLMTIKGSMNLSHQFNIIGEFSNYPMEQLMEWINTKSPPGAVFAGPMPTMATVKLCTKHPIVNHPHYEDAGLRERTKKVYQLYSRKSEQEVWQGFTELQVDFAIIEDGWCRGRSKPGCGMAEVWDLEDPDNMGKDPVCSRLKTKPQPYFKSAFKTKGYEVLQVLKQPLQEAATGSGHEKETVKS